MRTLSRAVVVVVLVPVVLLLGGAIQVLLTGLWQGAAERGDVPGLQVVTRDRPEWWRLSQAADAQGTTVRVAMCAACTSDEWAATYRITMPAGSRLLREVRGAPPGTVPQEWLPYLAGTIAVDGMFPAMSLSAIDQAQDGEHAIVVVDARWPETVRVPAQVTLRVGERPRGAAAAPPVVRVRVGERLVIDSVTGGTTVAQSRDRLTVRTGGRTDLTVRVVPRGAPTASPETLPRAVPVLTQLLRSLWATALLPAAPLAVLLLLLRSRRQGAEPRLATDVGTRRLRRVAVAAAAVLPLAAAVMIALPRLEFAVWYGAESRGTGLVAGVACRLVHVACDPEVAPGYLHQPGSYALGALLLGVALPGIARAVDEPLSSAHSRGRAVRVGAGATRVVIVGLLAGGAVAVVLVALERLGRQALDAGAFPGAVEPRAAVAAGCAAVALTACAALAGMALLGRRALVPAVTAGLLFSLVSVLVLPLTDAGGWLPPALTSVALIGAVAAAVHACVRILVTTWTGRPLRTRARAVRVAAVTLSVVASLPVPVAQPRAGQLGISFVEAYRAPGTALMALAVIAGAGVVALVRSELRCLPRRLGQGVAVRLRGLGVALGAVLFFSPTALVHGWVPLGYLVGVGLLWWFALPKELSADDEALRLQDPSRHRALINRLVTAREAEKTADKLRRGLAGELQSGALSWHAVRTRVGKVRAVATRARAGAATRGRSLEQVALGSYQREPWRCAQLGATAGLVAGLPWVLLAIPGVLSFIEVRGYGVLEALVATGLASLRWVAYGFLFGACYPLLRGHTGLTKGLTLFVATTLPAAVVLLSQPDPGERFRSFLYLASQLFVHAMLLGLGADLLALRRAGLPRRAVLAVHDVGALIAWGSGVTAAAATAVTTAVVTGLTTVVLGVLQPQAPPSPAPPTTPPASVSTR